ncbi:hypothetical protein TNCV_4032241 [Trichonephila clavipes]|nr:hypothetical protein TNCV_4032241 [Trichonephila clavipes]
MECTHPCDGLEIFKLCDSLSSALQGNGGMDPLCLHLYGNKKLYLKEGNNGRKGSFQRIREEMYVLSRKQQNIMNEIETAKQEWAMDQTVMLSTKLNKMKEKMT